MFSQTNGRNLHEIAPDRVFGAFWSQGNNLIWRWHYSTIGAVGPDCLQTRILDGEETGSHLAHPRGESKIEGRDREKKMAYKISDSVK